MPVREKSGKLFFDFFFRGIRCKEYTGLVDTAENRRYCEQKLRVVERDIARGSFDYRHHFPRGSRLHLFHPEDRMRDGAIATFADYVERWQRMRSPLLPDGGLVKDAELHPSTWLHDRTIIQRHLIPAFGPLRLCEIDVVRCNGFRRSLIDAGLSGKSVGNVAGLLHKVFADAVEEGLIDHNPVLRASSRRLRMSRRHRLTADPLSPDEIARFLAVVSDWYRDFYTVWFQVGWRSSEIVALRFGWLDFERQTVIIKRGRIPRLGGLEAEPKTGPREVQCFVRTRGVCGLPAAPGTRASSRSRGLCLHESARASAVTGVAERSGMEADAQARGYPRARAILHPRHVHHDCAVVR